VKPSSRLQQSEMNRVILCLIALSQGVFATTAYEALRIVGKMKGPEVLQNVFLIQGLDGAPHPARWSVFISQKGGGVRECVADGKQLLSERTRTDVPAGERINTELLQVDSDGVFQVANESATVRKFEYDRLDYRLTGRGSAGPQWEAVLRDRGSSNRATITIAADSRKVLASKWDHPVIPRNSSTIDPGPPRTASDVVPPPSIKRPSTETDPELPRPPRRDSVVPARSSVPAGSGVYRGRTAGGGVSEQREIQGAELPRRENERWEDPNDPPGKQALKKTFKQWSTSLGDFGDRVERSMQKGGRNVGRAITNWFTPEERRPQEPPHYEPFGNQ
jgi:hypothetical protein